MRSGEVTTAIDTSALPGSSAVHAELTIVAFANECRVAPRADDPVAGSPSPVTVSVPRLKGLVRYVLKAFIASLGEPPEQPAGLWLTDGPCPCEQSVNVDLRHSAPVRRFA